MQTGLLLCLLPNSDLEKAFNRWRSGLVFNSPLVSAFPPLLPLSWLSAAPDFSQLRKLANIMWPRAYLAEGPKLIANTADQTLMWPLRDDNLETYKADINQLLGDVLTDSPGRILDTANLPGFFLGLVNDSMGKEFTRSVSEGFSLSGKIFSAPFLGLLRVKLDLNDQIDNVFWELLAQFRVKKQLVLP